MQKGLNGVKLRAVKVGGTYHTTTVALTEFFAQVTAAQDQSGLAQVRRDCGHAQAERLLDAASI
jgi:hypothetical protein